MKLNLHVVMWLSDKLDDDGEMKLSFDGEPSWINKVQAVTLIKHLAKVFKLDTILEAIEMYEEKNK